MRLDTTYLKYITKDELRVLIAVEMGMRNHEYVPVHLIQQISKLKRANAFKVLQLLLKSKLIVHVQKKYDGYKLTFLGYDYLALYAFMKRGHIHSVIGKIGVGKESDIYTCRTPDDNVVILKLARLGRVSFRTIKKNRDYLRHRTSFNWLYMSRLSSIKEFSFMQILHQNGFPTPTPIDSNRHGIVMSLVDGSTLCNVKEIDNVGIIFEKIINLMKKFAENGLIHSDFNEFNLMISPTGELTVIDFPQTVSMFHPNAEFYFNRDLDCIHTYFKRKFNYNSETTLGFKEIEIKDRLDIAVKASGFLNKELLNRISDLEALEDYNEQGPQKEEDSDEENENFDENEEDQEDKEKAFEILNGEDDKDNEGEDYIGKNEEEIEEDQKNEKAQQKASKTKNKKLDQGVEGDEEKKADELGDNEDSEGEESSGEEGEAGEGEGEGEVEEEEEVDEETRKKIRMEKKALPKKVKTPKEPKQPSDQEAYIKAALKKKKRQKIKYSKNSSKNKPKVTDSDFVF